MADNIARVFAAAIAADPARPLLTWYDDATGERTELSGATLANWVAKTANLLVDEVGPEPRRPGRGAAAAALADRCGAARLLVGRVDGAWTTPGDVDVLFAAADRVDRGGGLVGRRPVRAGAGPVRRPAARGAAPGSPTTSWRSAGHGDHFTPRRGRAPADARLPTRAAARTAELGHRARGRGCWSTPAGIRIRSTGCWLRSQSAAPSSCVDALILGGWRTAPPSNGSPSPCRSAPAATRWPPACAHRADRG